MGNFIVAHPVADLAPSSDDLTDYDREHLAVYLRLLDARAAGSNLDDMARLILHRDPITDPAQARVTVTSHLARADWMTRRYRELLR